MLIAKNAPTNSSTKSIQQLLLVEASKVRRMKTHWTITPTIPTTITAPKERMEYTKGLVRIPLPVTTTTTTTKSSVAPPATTTFSIYGIFNAKGVRITPQQQQPPPLPTVTSDGNNEVPNGWCVPNVLMLVSILNLVPSTIRQGYVRCAGRAGYYAFEELVALGQGGGNKVVPVCVRVTPNQHFPIHLPTKQYRMDDATIVINQAAMDNLISSRQPVDDLGVASSVLYPPTITMRSIVAGGTMSYKAIKYVCDDTVVAVGEVIGSSSPSVEGCAVGDMELVGFNSVTTVHKEFLMGYEMKNLDLSPLRNVTVIGAQFLSTCDALIYLDLTPLQNVVCIGHHFLSRCSALEQVNLTALTSLTQIGHTGFMYRCTSLKSADLSTFTKLSRLGHNFMAVCSSLETLNLGALTNLQIIGDSFLIQCKSLKTLDFSTWASPSTGVDTIGSGFLSGCSSLVSVNLIGLGNATVLYRCFMNSCSSLTALDLTPFSQITSIGDYMLCYCSSLKSVDISSFGSVTSIGQDFFTDCSSLKIIHLSPYFHNVTSCGYKFLKGCTSARVIGDESSLLKSMVVDIKQKHTLHKA